MAKEEHPFYRQENTVSSTECTGLVQTGIGTEAEAEAYNALYPIHEQSPTDFVESK